MPKPTTTLETKTKKLSTKNNNRGISFTSILLLLLLVMVDGGSVFPGKTVSSTTGSPVYLYATQPSIFPFPQLILSLATAGSNSDY